MILTDFSKIIFEINEILKKNVEKKFFFEKIKKIQTFFFNVRSTYADLQTKY